MKFYCTRDFRNVYTSGWDSTIVHITLTLSHAQILSRLLSIIQGEDHFLFKIFFSRSLVMALADAMLPSISAFATSTPEEKQTVQVSLLLFVCTTGK